MKEKEKVISPEKLKELLIYDGGTGQLFWKEEARAGFKNSMIVHHAGDIAGGSRKDGRRVVRVGGILFMSYRVAWALYYGDWPKGEIDHINGITSDDRIENLRDVTRSVNQQNIKKAMANKKSSKLLGVYKDNRKKKKKWRSSIMTNGVEKYLGLFSTEAEAHAAYIKEKRKMHDGCTI